MSLAKSVADIAGQTAVVMRAAQSLGRAVAAAFHEGCASTPLDRDAAGLESLSAKLGDRVLPVVVDLADATQRAVGRVLEHADTVNTLVHNAAIFSPKPFETPTVGHPLVPVDIRIQSAFLLAKAVWSGVRVPGGGCVYCASSRSGTEGFQNESAYSTTKRGLKVWPGTTRPESRRSFGPTCRRGWRLLQQLSGRPHQAWRLYCHADETPARLCDRLYDSVTFNASIEATLVGGKLVYQAGEIIGQAGDGGFVRPSRPTKEEVLS